MVSNDQHRFETTQRPVGTPVLGQLDRTAGQVAGELVERGLKAFEQGEGIGGAAGEAGQHPVLVQAPHLDGVALHDGLSGAHLAVAAKRDLIATPDAEDGGCVKGLHVASCA